MSSIDTLASISWNEELKRKHKEQQLEQRIKTLEQEVVELKRIINLIKSCI